jgi:hypothetical protein
MVVGDALDSLFDERSVEIDEKAESPSRELEIC